jgi:hypothetical protein
MSFRVTAPTPDHLDSNIARLVHTLNRVPGVQTVSSCGGHPRPVRFRRQWPAGSWYAKFVVTPDNAGRQALDRVASVVADYHRRSGEHVCLVSTVLSPEEPTPAYAVEGRNHADADRLAEYLTAPPAVPDQ